MNTGERLRQLREQYRLSQNDVAKVLQVTTSLISSYEHGERTPSPSKLVQLADLYPHTMPPRKREPVSPMKTLAGWKL